MEIEAYVKGANVALGTNVTANSAQNSPTILVDGNTMWDRFETSRDNPGQPSLESPHRIEIDLGKIQPIEEIRVVLEGGWAVSFGLFLSMDGKEWVKLDSYSDVGGTIVRTVSPSFYIAPSGLDDDGDGLDNAFENGTGKTVGFSHGTSPNDPDSDDDGLNDLDEIKVFGTDPLSDDSDGDGLSDLFEVKVHGSNPMKADSDSDGIFDGQEGAELVSNADHDTDGVINIIEILYDSDPVDSNKRPALGVNSGMPKDKWSRAYLTFAQGNRHTIALNSTGTIEGWGTSYYGESTQPAGLSSSVAIAAARNASRALSADGAITSWGRPGDYPYLPVPPLDGSRGAGWVAAPLIDVIYPATEIAAGAAAEIRFDVTANAEQVEVRRNGVPVYSKATPQVGNAHSIAAFGEQDSGIYEVIAWNSQAVTSSRTQIQIAGAPRVAINGSDATPLYQVSGGAMCLLSESPVSLTLSTSFANGAIFYTTNGSAPAPLPANRYVGAFSVPAGSEVTLRAVAYNADFSRSVAMKPVTINPENKRSLTLEVPVNGNVFVGNSTNPSAPGVTYHPNGQTLWMRAVANSNFHFVAWEDGDTAPLRKIDLNANRTVSATFRPNFFIQGSSSSGGVADVLPIRSSYRDGQTVAFIAKPTQGWFFKRWDGSFDGKPQSFYEKIRGDLSSTAVFETTLRTNVVGAGTVTRSLDSIRYEADTTVMLTASPAPGKLFVRWTGTVNSFENPVLVTIDQPHVINAVFLDDPNSNFVTLTASADPVSAGKVTGGGTYSPGSYVSLNAEAEQGYVFLRWLGDVNDKRNPLSVRIDADSTVKAQFLRNDGDEDGDGLTNADEINGWIVDGKPVKYNVDPLVSDTDGDGLNDKVEIIEWFSDPTAPDTDSDGLADGVEVLTHKTDPTLADTDRDGLTDFEETRKESVTLPTNGDMDLDGIPDGAEIRTFGTDPNMADTDSDGFDDAFEIESGFDPKSETSTPDAVSSIRTAVEFRFNAANGESYRIETSTDLTNWVVEENGIIGNGGVITRFYTIENMPKRYFRARRN